MIFTNVVFLRSSSSCAQQMSPLPSVSSHQPSGTPSSLDTFPRPTIIPVINSLDSSGKKAFKGGFVVTKGDKYGVFGLWILIGCFQFTLQPMQTEQHQSYGPLTVASNCLVFWLCLANHAKPMDKVFFVVKAYRVTVVPGRSARLAKSSEMESRG